MTDTEKLKELSALVKDMRDTQKAYFKSRQQSDLQASKHRERKVDEWTKNNGDVISKPQTELF